MIYFLSFATTNMAPSLRRIGKEARESGFFDKIYLYNEKNLDWQFRKSHRQYFRDYPRGYGYWIWKSYLISKIMREKMHEGDILVYLDAGCEIKSSGKKRFFEYVELLNVYSIVLFRETNQTERKRTKYDILQYFHVENDMNLINSSQFLSGAIFLRKDSFSIRLINLWKETCELGKTTLLCDTPSNHKEFDGYIENRHDQSLLSIICKTMDKEIINEDAGNYIYILHADEFWRTDWKGMEKFPFWAKRNKEFSPPSVWTRIVRKLKRLLSK